MHQRRPSLDRSHAARLLGCDSMASPAEVVEAHRRFVRRHHPDRGGDGADLSLAAEARDLLVGSTPAGAVADQHTRTRTFHRRPPWWRRLIPWRIT